MELPEYRRSKKTFKLKYRVDIKVFVVFILFELLLAGIMAPFVIFYGPFENLKKTVVGAAMSSFTHQYIAKIFLSDEQIAKILHGNISGSNDSNMESNDLSQINPNNRNGNIEYFNIQGHKFDGYMLVVHDPTRVRVGVTNKLGIQGEKTSQIAREYNAVAAINGGGFTDKSQNSTAIWTGTGAFPEGIVMIDGKVFFPKEGVDVQARIPGSVVGINQNGVLVVGQYTFDDLVRKKIRDAITFGPPLILNGKVLTRDPNGNDINNQGTAPRTAIGQRKDGAILMLVIDGRQGLKMGATIKDVQTIMTQQKAFNAINLDGGASSTLYYMGKVVNNPSDKFGERPIPTIIYVK